MARHDRGKVASIVVYMLEHGELSFSQSLTNSKLDIHLFRGPFLFILHQYATRVGGWDFSSS